MKLFELFTFIPYYKSMLSDKMEPINAKSFSDFNKYFKKETNDELLIILEFFNCMSMISSTDNDSIVDNMQELLTYLNFDTIEKANEFMQCYMKFYNSIIEFVCQVEKFNHNEALIFLDDVVNEIIKTCESNNLENEELLEMLQDFSFATLNDIFSFHHVELGEDLPVEKIVEILFGFIKKSDKHSGELYTILITYPVGMRMGDIEIDRGKISLTLKAIIMIYVKMYTERKKTVKHVAANQKTNKNVENTIQVNFANKKVDRNAPCPCGSGKKYKKCCMGKDLQINSPKNTRNIEMPAKLLDNREVKLFYSLYNELMSFAIGKYDKKHKNDKMLISNIDGSSRINPKIKSIIFDVKTYFSENKNTIIDEYIGNNNFNAQDGEILLSWKKSIYSDFFIMEMFPNGCAAFMDEKDNIYYVYPLYDKINDVIGMDLPYIGKTALLPFMGRIIYDGLISSYNVKMGNNASSEMYNMYMKNDVVFSL